MSDSRQSEEMQFKEDFEQQLSVAQVEDENESNEQDFRQPGEIVGRHFEVICVLGGGGQSVVYKARHQMLDKVYAVKVMLPDKLPNDKAVRRFQQEAKAVSKLDHSAIVKVHEFDLDDAGQPYIVMDYVEGVSLAAMIHESGCLASNQAIALISQATEALALAHAKGVVHRDIKPSNIMVITDQNGAKSIKLVDFGIAKLTLPEGQKAALTHTGEVFGSPLYMSPEQCLGKPVDVATDIYSLGCVLYECLMGSPPFTGASFLEILMAHVQQPPNKMDNRASRTLQNIISRCLEKEPAARYHSMSDLRTDLDKAQRGLPIDYSPVEHSSTSSSITAEREAEKDAAKSPDFRNYLIYFLSFFIIMATFVGISEFLKSRQVAPIPVTTPVTAAGGGYGGASGASFLQSGQVPPHRADPITSWSTDYQKADRYDLDTLQLFGSGKYEKAIADLNFCTKTYKENGTHYGNPDIETAFLGEAYYHLHQCYSGLGKQEQAAASLREAVRLFGEIKLSDHWTSVAIGEYANLLRAEGKDAEAGKMLAEFQQTRRVTHLP